MSERRSTSCSAPSWSVLCSPHIRCVVAERSCCACQQITLAIIVQLFFLINALWMMRSYIYSRLRQLKLKKEKDVRKSRLPAMLRLTQLLVVFRRRCKSAPRRSILPTQTHCAMVSALCVCSTKSTRCYSL